MTLQVGSPLILTCEVLGLPAEVNSGLLVQWMKRGSVSSDVAGAGGVEVLILTLLTYFDLYGFVVCRSISIVGQSRGVVL